MEKHFCDLPNCQAEITTRPIPKLKIDTFNLPDTFLAELGRDTHDSLDICQPCMERVVPKIQEAIGAKLTVHV